MQRVEGDVTSARALRRALADAYKDVRQVREDMPQHSEVQFDNAFVSVSFKLSLLLRKMRPFVINENDESPRSGRSDSSSEDAGKTHGDDTSKGNGKGKGVGKNNGNDSSKNKRKRQRQGKRQRLETAERSETGHNMHVLITNSTSCVQ